MTPPQTIHFLSDRSTAELVRPINVKEGVYEYRYTRCFEPNDKPFPMSLDRIKYLVSVKLMEAE